MTLGLAAMMVVGMAVTIGSYIYSKQHLAALADRVAKQVQIEIENIRNQSAESEERLIHAFVNWVDEDEALQQYHAERSALLTVDGANKPWDWAEPGIQRWAEERRRRRCAAGQRSTVVSASLAVLGLWCAIAVVTLLSLQSGRTTTVMPITGTPGADQPAFSGDPWAEWQQPGSDSALTDLPAMPTFSPETTSPSPYADDEARTVRHPEDPGAGSDNTMPLDSTSTDPDPRTIEEEDTQE